MTLRVTIIFRTYHIHPDNLSLFEFDFFIPPYRHLPVKGRKKTKISFYIPASNPIFVGQRVRNLFEFVFFSKDKKI